MSDERKRYRTCAQPSNPRGRAGGVILKLARKVFEECVCNSKIPSAFSKSIGFTLCGIAEDPTSPLFGFCVTHPSLM